MHINILKNKCYIVISKILQKFKKNVDRFFLRKFSSRTSDK